MPKHLFINEIGVILPPGQWLKKRRKRHPEWVASDLIVEARFRLHIVKTVNGIGRIITRRTLIHSLKTLNPN